MAAHASPVTVPVNRKIRAAIATISDGAWTPVTYPRAIWDEDQQRLISDAEVAEVPYTAFASKKGKAITARLIVRRVRDLGRRHPEGQGELFTAWRYHAVFTDSPFEMIQAESQHRDYLLTEQQAEFPQFRDRRRRRRLRSMAMLEPGGLPSDRAEVVVGAGGCLEETGEACEPYRLIDPGGMPVEAAAAYFRDLQAAGRSEATVRSYGMDLLRWFRFLWAAGMPWEQATRAEARDFCRWMQVAGKPARPHWRAPRAAADSAVAGRRTRRRCGRTARRCCAAFTIPPGGWHRADRQPVPAGPVAPGRAGARAPQPDGAATATSGRGFTGRRVPSRIPRSVPDEEFNEIFARLPSHRDRALVAFYVSTGARASELLSATQGGPTRGGR